MVEQQAGERCGEVGRASGQEQLEYSVVTDDLLCDAGHSTTQLGLRFLSYYLNLG